MNIKGTPSEVSEKVQSSGAQWAGEVEIYYDTSHSFTESIRVLVSEREISIANLQAESKLPYSVEYRHVPVSVSINQMNFLAEQLGEKTLFGRTGGASTLAVGMAQIFSKVVRGRGLDLWYHFAIMFEALFILTTLDAGTRVGRYLLQDLLGHIWKPLGETKNVAATWLASVLIVSAWGYFLIQGVKDPLGGINSLWPLFGIANQLLAAIGLCLATTIILKMQLGGESKVQSPKPKVGRPAFALIALVPLIWLLSVTMTASVQKIFHSDPRIGFLSAAKALDSKLPQLRQAIVDAKPLLDSSVLQKGEKAVKDNRTLRFNLLLDAVVTGIFLSMVILIVALSLREWILLLARKRLASLRESEAVWLPDYAIAEAKPLHVFSIIALAFALAKELSGEAAMERAQIVENNCCAEKHRESNPETKSKETIYVKETERRFSGGVNRCC
jgi:carbon starvation protein